MDEKLRREIARRLTERERAREHDQTTRAHIEALAEVYKVEIAEVEAIVAEIGAERFDAPDTASSFAQALRRYQVLLGLVGAALILAAAVLALRPSPERGVEVGGTGVVTPNVRPNLEASVAASILAGITPIRMMMMEYQMSQGEFPSTLEDLGLDRQEMRTGRYIDDLVLGPAGQILVRVDESLAVDAYLTLIPRQTMGGLNIEWRCVTTLPVGTQSVCERGDLSDAISEFRSRQ